MKGHRRDTIFGGSKSVYRSIACYQVRDASVLTYRVRGWQSEDWTDSDDRVRGGSSQVRNPLLRPTALPLLFAIYTQTLACSCCKLTIRKSYLDCHLRKAIFRGHLDTKTLGGAGFASQRTTGDGRSWDLSHFDGLLITINTALSDEKKYTLICKDQLLPPDSDSGREQATTSWEFDFNTSSAGRTQQASDDHTIFAKWSEFKPTYRGKPRKDAGKLDLKGIKRFSIMMRR